MRSFINFGFPIKTVEAPGKPSIRYNNLADRKSEQQDYQKTFQVEIYDYMAEFNNDLGEVEAHIIS